MEKYDPKISAVEVAKIFKKMDRDGNGQITFEGLLNKFPFSYFQKKTIFKFIFTFRYYYYYCFLNQKKIIK